MSSEYLPMTAADGGVISSAMAARAPQEIRVGEAVAEESSPSAQLARLLNHALRGRYLLVVVLGVALGSLLAAGAWLFTPLPYQSQGLVRLALEVPRVMTPQTDYKPMEVYAAIMQSQVALMSSAKVTGEALKDPMWEERGFKGISKMSPDLFANDLRLEYRPGTEHIKVIYTSSDPKYAATAVQTVIRAYSQVYQQMDQTTLTERTTALEGRRDQVQKLIDDLDAQLNQEAQAYGSANVDKLYDQAVQGVTRVQAQLVDVRIALALAQGSKVPTAVRYTPQQIARMDPTMERYLRQREQVEASLEQLRLRGYGEGHNQVVALQKQLDTTAEKIAKYAKEFQAAMAAGTAVVTGPAGAAGPFAGMSADELTVKEKNLIALSDKTKKEMTDLGATKLKVESLQKEIGKAQSELADLGTKLAQVQIENGVSGRLSVLSTGEVPTSPTRDRRPQFAAVAGLTGLALPAACFVAASALWRRYRYSADAAEDLSGKIPLLGILPQLPARLTDPESAADAAQCVHQIRVMLQVQADERSPVVYHVTSACPGEGKTSLVASLALSYAAAGHRTVVVDADLIGQRLTRGYGLEDQPGFREAIGGIPKSGLTVYASGVPGLSVLPAGISDGRDACAVSSGAVRRMLADLKGRFDVILIDSGPILGSLESLVVAGLADGVILAISREQQKPLVDRAVRQLKSVGARIAGMVFNRAERADFRRSVGVSSLRSVPRSSESSLVKTGVTSTSGFGSLVDSVQTYLPAGG